MRSTLTWLVAATLAPMALAAQTTRPAAYPEHPHAGRLNIDGVYSRLWVQRPYPEKWTSSLAVGARLTYRARPSDQLDQPLAARFAFGAQFSMTPRQALDFGRYRVSQAAALADFFPLGYGRRVEPILSFSAGALRTQIDDQRLPSSVMTMPEGTQLRLAMTPGAGLRVNLVNRLGIRAEYRDTFVRYRRWWHAPELSAGASLRL